VRYLTIGCVLFVHVSHAGASVVQGNMGANKSFKLKKSLAKKAKQNRPLPQW